MEMATYLLHHRRIRLRRLFQEKQEHQFRHQLQLLLLVLE
jgi:hypothetical protein